MNRPSILDLRPGHSFVEYMVGQGYDVYLLDWGVPGLEDKESEIRRLCARLSAARDPQDEERFRAFRIQLAGLVHRRDSHHDLRGAATG